MNSKYIEKPLQLLSVDSLGHLILHDQALQFISNLREPVSIVCIAGPYRTGKSYLLNSLLGLCINHPLFASKSSQLEPDIYSQSKQLGFKVGKTTNSCTKGLWIYNRPILTLDSQDKVVNMLFLDSEGLGDARNNNLYDYRVLAIGLLISNVLLYNSKNVIEASSISELMQILDIVDSVKGLYRTQQSRKLDFHWILRDFHLELIDEEGRQLSSDEYMRLCLKRYENFKPTMESLNKNFSSLRCHTFVKPFFDQANQLEQRPEFTSQIIELKKYFKSISSNQSNGDSLSKKLLYYVKAVNNQQKNRYQQELSKAYINNILYEKKAQGMHKLKQLLELYEPQIQLNCHRQDQLNLIKNRIKEQIDKQYGWSLEKEEHNKQFWKDIEQQINQYTQNVAQLGKEQLSRTILSTSIKNSNQFFNQFSIRHEAPEFSLPVVEHPPTRTSNQEIQTYKLKLQLEQTKKQNNNLREMIRSLTISLQHYQQIDGRKSQQLNSYVLKYQSIQRQLGEKEREYLSCKNRLERQHRNRQQILNEKISCLESNRQEISSQLSNKIDKLKEKHKEQIISLQNFYQEQEQTLKDTIDLLKTKINTYQQLDQDAQQQDSSIPNQSAIYSMTPHHLIEYQNPNLNLSQVNTNLSKKLASIQQQYQNIIQQFNQYKLEKKSQIYQFHKKLEQDLRHQDQLHSEVIEAKQQTIHCLKSKIDDQHSQISNLTQQCLEADNNYDQKLKEMRENFEQQLKQAEKIYEQLINDYQIALASNTQKSEQIAEMQEILEEQKIKLTRMCDKQTSNYQQQLGKMTELLRNQEQQINHFSAQVITESSQNLQLKYQLEQQTLKHKDLYQQKQRQKEIWAIIRDGYEHKLNALSEICDKYRMMLEDNHLITNLGTETQISLNSIKQEDWKDGCVWGVNYQKQIEGYKNHIKMKYKSPTIWKLETAATNTVDPQNNFLQPNINQRESTKQGEFVCQSEKFLVKEAKSLSQYPCSGINTQHQELSNLNIVTDKSIQYSEQKIKTTSNRDGNISMIIKDTQNNKLQPVRLKYSNNDPQLGFDCTIDNQGQGSVVQAAPNYKNVPINGDTYLTPQVHHRHEYEHKRKQSSFQQAQYKDNDLNEWYENSQSGTQKNCDRTQKPRLLNYDRQWMKRCQKLYQCQLQHHKDSQKTLKQYLQQLASQYRQLSVKHQHCLIRHEENQEEIENLKKTVSEQNSVIEAQKQNINDTVHEALKDTKQYLGSRYQQACSKLKDKEKQLYILNQQLASITRQNNQKFKAKNHQHAAVKQKLIRQIETLTKEAQIAKIKYKQLQEAHLQLRKQHSLAQQEIVHCQQSNKINITLAKQTNKRQLEQELQRFEIEQQNFENKYKELQKHYQQEKLQNQGLSQRNRGLLEQIKILTDNLHHQLRQNSHCKKAYERTIRILKAKIYQQSQQSPPTAENKVQLAQLLEMTRKNYTEECQIWANKEQKYERLLDCKYKNNQTK